MKLIKTSISERNTSNNYQNPVLISFRHHSCNIMRLKCRPPCWSVTSTALLFWITFGVMLPSLCSDWGYSFFFSKLKWPQDILTLRAVQLNHERLEAAEAYLSDLDHQNTMAMFLGGQPRSSVDLVVSVVTVPRDHPKFRLGYLTQTIAQLIRIYKTDNGSGAFPDRLLFMCNTHQDPASHGEARRLSKYVPYHLRYPNNTGVRVVFKNKFEKEKEDYVFCLQEALRYHPKYVIILEDDVIPHPETFRILQYHLSKPWFKKYNTKANPLAFLKLYYPLKWHGYGKDPKHIIELLSLGCLGGSFFQLCFHLLSRTARSSSSSSTMIKRYFFFLLGATYFILLVVSIGRQYVLDLRWSAWQLSTTIPAPDCCTQGVLYPTDMAQKLIDYLQTVTCSAVFPVDLAMDAFAKSHGYQRRLVEPNLLTHVGMVSSLRYNSKSPKDFIF